MAFQSPNVYGQPGSQFLDPNVYGNDPRMAGRLLGQNTVGLRGLGNFAVSSNPNDPLRQMLGGRLPNEGPQAGMANQFMSNLGYGAPSGGIPGYDGGQGGMGSQGGMGGQSGMGGMGGMSGGAPFGAVTPGQLNSLTPPTGSIEDQLAGRARQMAFQEFERIPGLYQGDLAQETQGAIRRQLSGEDAPFTPNVQNLLSSRIGSQAAAENAARERMIGDQAGGRGLGGGGMELGMRLASREAAAKQRAQQGSNLDITSALENFGSRERGRAAGQNYLNSQVAGMTPAVMAKGNMLGRYEVTGDSPFSGMFGTGSGGFGGGMGGGGGVVGYGGVQGAQVGGMSNPMQQLLGGNTSQFMQPRPQDPMQQQLDYMQKIAGMFGLGGGKAQQATQVGQYGMPIGPTPRQPAAPSSPTNPSYFDQLF